MIPSYMFWNSFCEWLGKTNLCQNLTASRLKLFWGTPLAPAPKIEFVWPFSNSPTHPHYYAVTYIQVKNPSPPPPPPSPGKHPLPS
jgi:hypothetical protein